MWKFRLKSFDELFSKRLVFMADDFMDKTQRKRRAHIERERDGEWEWRKRWIYDTFDKKLSRKNRRCSCCLVVRFMTKLRLAQCDRATRARRLGWLKWASPLRGSQRPIESSIAHSSCSLSFSFHGQPRPVWFRFLLTHPTALPLPSSISLSHCLSLFLSRSFSHSSCLIYVGDDCNI